MTKLEEKILDYITRNIFIISFITVTLLSLIIRFLFRDFMSGDAVDFYLPWFDEIKNSGGILALSKQFGDYNLLYQFIISLLTYIPMEPLYALKLLSVTFDYLGAFCILNIINTIFINKSDSNWLGLLGYSIYLFNPTVFLNSACWAQCDSIYTGICLAALLMLLKEKYRICFIFLGLALAFKLQAIFILPFFCLYWFASRKFSISKFLYTPLTFLLSGAPSYLAGREILDSIKIYYWQSKQYSYLVIGYPSFWYSFIEDYSAGDMNLHKTLESVATLFTLTALISIMLYIVIKKIEITSINAVAICYILTYSCAILLPCMHERYGFLAEALSIIAAILVPRMVTPVIIMCSLSWFTYSAYLFDRSVNRTMLSVINLIVYFICMKIVLGKITEKKI